MSWTRVRARILAVEARPSPALRTEVARVARSLEIDEAELVAEAENLARQFQRHGITTREGQLRFVAKEAGCPVEDLERELATIEEAIA
ncbi:MAG: hypothetical protein WBA46_15455 [Thermomicrobiales bacterium]